MRGDAPPWQRRLKLGYTYPGRWIRFWWKVQLFFRPPSRRVITAIDYDTRTITYTDAPKEDSMRRLADVLGIMIILASLGFAMSRAVQVNAANQYADQLAVQLRETEYKLDRCVAGR